ncbi:hypothetical protein C922_03840 [Plasmodium inui San Antonio 1]|uniref:Uncharacterized protein n=1 Tax=Plasmodium inui San Antonio 1 TaxID=1237626 RepID=W6ZYD1_9APIC|nr:hypothetical protein C922_03840 [Plasmodium inui San Antonio 1]EUD65857.1 hypothetical protein C922_03840 [Plasmodium inui San Antonio 1]
MKKDKANLKVKAIGIKPKKQPTWKSSSNVNPKSLLKAHGQNGQSVCNTASASFSIFQKEFVRKDLHIQEVES